MDHKKIKELIQLYACDELNKKEIEIVENHMLECEECSKEYSSMKQLYFAFTENAPKQVGDHLVNQARENLMESLYDSASSVEPEKHSLFDKLINLISSPVRFSVGVASLVVAGILMGNLFTSNAPVFNGGGDIDNLDYNTVDVANVRLVPSSNNNEVEILYKSITPNVYKGKLDDKKVQQLLAKAIVSGNNPGVKITSLNAFADQQGVKIKPDQGVKTALIKALKNDSNDGVRKQALNVLMNYPTDEQIQKALLYVLSTDKNPGLRVMAVNALGKIKSSGQQLNDELFNYLSQEAEKDRNSFVRLKAADLIEGGK